MDGLPPVKVAMIGLAAAASAVSRRPICGSEPHLRLTPFCNQGIDRHKVDWAPADVGWTGPIREALASDVDIVVGRVDSVVSSAPARGRPTALGLRMTASQGSM